MNIIQRFNGLYLNNDFVVYKNINSLTSLKFHLFINQRQWLLLQNMQT